MFRTSWCPHCCPKTSSSSKPAVNDQPPGSGLHRNAIGLAEVLFQSVAAMAPASAVAFSLGAAVPFAGTALPLATLIALAVCTLIALNIAALAKYLPSAGGYFTYVSHGLGEEAGWLTGWLFSLAYVLIVPLVLLVLGPLADDFAGQHFHLAWGWIVWALLIGCAPLALTLSGLKLSSDSSVVLGESNIGVLSCRLAYRCRRSPFAAGHFYSEGLEPGLAGWQGILHGMIFVFLAFSGFESSAPMAEEARDPRRTVPRAIILARLSNRLLQLRSYAAVAGWERIESRRSIGSEPMGRDGETRVGREKLHHHFRHFEQRAGQCRRHRCRIARDVRNEPRRNVAPPVGAHPQAIPNTGRRDFHDRVRGNVDHGVAGNALRSVDCLRVGWVDRISLILRFMSRRGVKNMSRATCMVMVLAPWRMPPALRLATAARKIPCQSTPWCLKKRSSSVARNA